MAFEDKELQCAECRAPFVFTAGEQEFFQSLSLKHEPKRCMSCRQRRRAQRGVTEKGIEGPHLGQPSYPIICADCGRRDTVPFEPKMDRPLYCRGCMRRRREAGVRG